MRVINIYKILHIRYLILVAVLCSTGVQSQTLNDYLSMATQNNPEIQSAYKTFEAALEKAPQVSSLPDPSLTMSAFGRMIETRLGTQEARFSFMQMFPWFGTLEAKKSAANLMAEATFQKYLDSKNEVFLMIKKSYAEIYELNRMVQIEERNLEILDNYRELALSKFKSGKGAMVDVVRIDIKRNDSETKIQLLNEQNEPLQIEFNSLLNRDLNALINIPDALPLVDVTSLLESDSLFVSNPKLLGLDKMIASYEAQKKIVKNEGLPMIGLGLDYSIISKRDVPGLEMNGQDAIMPMLSVTLPIFRKKYKAKQNEVAFMLEATTYDKQAVKNKLQTMYSMANYKFSKANTLNALYKKQTESTQQAISLLIAAYSNSGINFEEILRMNQDLLMLQTATVLETKNQFVAQSTIDYLIANQQ
ncbi:TolC family protein [Mariniflexile sp. AS56]|uniref:TolC family protein n=1 Tax=Mariniflexile sp. AS56 TaxID=3063957 RepID=UPI0026F1994F|nr:TolC family protein [Mariniflexile sp. AS56]MDO7171125.1 TolC family protein [Mariniflexile sp. AS56]